MIEMITVSLINSLAIFGCFGLFNSVKGAILTYTIHNFMSRRPLGSYTVKHIATKLNITQDLVVTYCIGDPRIERTKIEDFNEWRLK